MLKRRIIPCLDVKDGRVVKGIKFDNIKDVNDPVVLASHYASSGADELVFYDITASFEKRKLRIELIKDIAKSIHIPFTVGGGINTIEDIESVLLSGADKVSLNSGAIDNPELITEGALRFGSQCIVLSIDVKKVGSSYKVFKQGGRLETTLHAIDWAIEAEKRGAGELVINSMDRDGIQDGFDIKLLKAIEAVVNIPVIASGGAGTIEDFIALAKQTQVDGYLAASVFHYQTFTIQEVKEHLHKEGIRVRR
jgi:cyclase